MLYVSLQKKFIFAEQGFCVELDRIAPGGLRKDMYALFVPQNAEGKAVGSVRIPGCDGAGEDMVMVPLKPYADAQLGRACVYELCNSLVDARDGCEQEQLKFWCALARVINGAIDNEALSTKDRLNLQALLIGRAETDRQLSECIRGEPYRDISVTKEKAATVAREALGL